MLKDFIVGIIIKLTRKENHLKESIEKKPKKVFNNNFVGKKKKTFENTGILPKKQQYLRKH